MFKMASPFIDSNFSLSAQDSGVLNGLKFAVKDVFDIAGHTSSLGNPLWWRTHLPAHRTAPAIEELLAHGATLKGLTISDELMFSIKGLNIHFGSPLNPKHPDAFTGGSSSGSASAVASGFVDFALGTDTGGSIRVPASYCDLYGFRPTCHAVGLSGVTPLAQTLDTIGVLANDPTTLTQVGKVLHQHSTSKLSLKRLVYFPETFNQSDRLRWLNNLKKVTTIPIHAVNLPLKFSPEILLTNFQQIQGYEAWQNDGQWLESHHAKLGSDIQAHFDLAKRLALKHEAYQIALEQRRTWQSFLNHLLAEDSLLILPTTSSVALPFNCSVSAGESVRHQTQLLTTLAGLSGCPQLVIPANQKAGLNSVSFISAQNQDHDLLKLNSVLTHLVSGVTLSNVSLLNSAG